ncbi:MAG TPA: discoidin domain-containing protein, partial [Pseudoxanthomonas sp.]|nr:discoidin domain-containing protein [Pseudoxanthomonas sp.]
AGIQRDLPLDYPDNYQFQFQLRGDSPHNDLQFKLVDASGDNVWWVNRPRYDFPQDWTTVTYKRRHIDKAWGPSPDRELRKSARIEYTIYNAVGGKGSVCFDDLTLQTLPAQDTSPLRATVLATGTMPDSQAASAVDGREDTAWGAQLHGLQAASLTLDLGSVREWGGLVLDWRADRHAARYRIETSSDGKTWNPRAQIEDGNGGRDYIALPETEARYLRLWPEDGPWTSAWLSEARVQALSFAATSNDLLKAVAADAPKGRFPRGFVGEQSYWTILGIDGGSQQGLIGEDGAVELHRGGPSIAPFVHVRDASLKPRQGQWISWADARASQSLQDRYLPIPSVHWQHAQVELTTTAFAQGEPGHAQLVARYRLSNPTRKTLRYTLALALQPWQVNPPSQFLNTPGGYSPLRDIALEPQRILIDGKPRVYASTGEQALASHFAQDLAVLRLDELRPEAREAARTAQDDAGLASAAWAYTVELKPGESREFSWWAPLEGDDMLPADFDAAQAQARVAAHWHDKLDQVQLRVPAQGQALVDTLRTSLAHMLISRIGPRLQPGTRSYSRSWIRDGAMISEGLLRLGRDE